MIKLEEDFKRELKEKINKGGWGEENLESALPVIEKYFYKYVRTELLSVYKDGFQAALDTLEAANKSIQSRKIS